MGGNLPAGLGGLSDLEELHLHTNRLSGPIPSELGNLGELTVLWLHDNQFSGELPGELTNIGSLEQVSLFGNNLEWADSYAPGIVADMVGLLALYESASGEGWSNSSNWQTITPVGEWHGVTTGAGGLVTELNLSGNGLDGEIPLQLGNLLSLTKLHLDSNQLSGEIPPSLGNLVSLEELLLNDNQLKGEIPSGMTRLTSLTKLHLNNNQLSGPIPSQVSNLVDLEEFNVSNNLLSGPVPSEIGSLSNLKLLYLDTNELTGELPTELSDLANLDLVSLSDNRFTWAAQYSPGIVADLVALLALYESARGDDWDNNSNWNTVASVSTWRGVTTGPGGLVTELNLRDNGLTGRLPTQLGNIATLTKLDVGANQLGQEIPVELGNLTNLNYLNLGTNGFTGEIPSELGNLANLEELYLDTNQLSGLVPPELGNLSTLKILYLHNNQLSGELPTQLGQLSNLQQVSIWDNHLAWSDRYENGILADTVGLVALYESTNGSEWLVASRVDWSHSGSEIKWLRPAPLGEWDRVTTFNGRVTEVNLSDFHHSRGYNKVNGMAGTIPSALGNLTALQVLKMSGDDHKLTGCIPASLQGIEYDGDLPFC